MNRIRRLISWLRGPSKRELLLIYRNREASVRVKLTLDLESGKHAHADALRMGSDSTYWKGYCQAMHELLDYVKGL